MSQHYRKRSDSPFGKALKELLRRKGLTQATLAQKSMVPVETLSRMIKGDRLHGASTRMHLRNIVRACYQLGLIHTVDEANALITQIPSTKELDRRNTDDLAVLLELEALPVQEPQRDAGWQPGGFPRKSWKAMQTLEDVAWSLYLELVIRIATQPLASTQGLLREALDSLYTLFTETRAILHEAGARLATAGEMPIGLIGIDLLNEGLRPFMAKWHPLLQHYEKSRRDEQSVYEHEQQWERAEEMRAELTDLQGHLEMYAETFADIAGVPHRKLARLDRDLSDE